MNFEAWIFRIPYNPYYAHFPLTELTVSIPSECDTVWISIRGGSYKRLLVPSKALNLSDRIKWSRSSRVSHSAIRSKSFLSSMSRKAWQLRHPLSFSVGSIIERSVCITSVRLSKNAFIVILTMITRTLLSAKKYTRDSLAWEFSPRFLSENSNCPQSYFHTSCHADSIHLILT